MTNPDKKTLREKLYRLVQKTRPCSAIECNGCLDMTDQILQAVEEMVKEDSR